MCHHRFLHSIIEIEYIHQCFCDTLAIVSGEYRCHYLHQDSIDENYLPVVENGRTSMLQLQ